MVKVKVETKGDFKALEDFLRVSSTVDSTEILRKYAEEGLTRLRRFTPVRTGETAQGWRYRIEKTATGATLEYYNIAHPHTKLSVAILIEYGHGTRTGAYVPPYPYIKQALQPVYQKINDTFSKIGVNK